MLSKGRCHIGFPHTQIYRVHSLYFVKNPYNPYMISCTDFRKSVHKIRTSVHKIRTSGFKSVHMLFKFYLFFTCHSCIWKVMSLEPYIFSQDIGWKKTVIWFSMKKDTSFVLIEYKIKICIRKQKVLVRLLYKQLVALPLQNCSVYT